ncbi:MAG: ABC transporter ATP-binding protein [Devosia sp.]
MNDTVLSVDHLTVSFHTYAGKVEAVRDVSFSLARGEVLAIVGESGSGKSVTAQALLGLTPIPPGEVEAGTIELGGRDIAHAGERELAGLRGQRIAMIFQDPMTSLNPSMQIGAQIREVLHQHHRMSAAESEERTTELLHLVGMPEPETRMKQYPHQFSGGMRQRIMIAIAIANDPDILVADEPTTALDVTIQSQIFRLIRDIQQRLGMAMILITHDLGLVAGTANRIAVMYGGRIVEEGLTEQIYYRPQHPYTLGLLTAVPKLSDEGDAPLRTIEGLPPLLIDPPDACAFADRCPFVMKICREKGPPYFQPLDGNRAACWLHHEQARAQRQVFDAAARQLA